MLDPHSAAQIQMNIASQSDGVTQPMDMAQSETSLTSQGIVSPYEPEQEQLS